MPVMVDFHGLGVDMGLQHIEGIAERRNRERPGRGGRCSGGGGLREDKARHGRDGGDAGGRTEETTAR